VVKDSTPARSSRRTPDLRRWRRTGRPGRTDGKPQPFTAQPTPVLRPRAADLRTGIAAGHLPRDPSSGHCANAAAVGPLPAVKPLRSYRPTNHRPARSRVRIRLMEGDRNPGPGREAFHCPTCRVYAKQEWSDLLYRHPVGQGFAVVNGYMIAHCTSCPKPSIWAEDFMIYPLDRQGDEPHEEMPSTVRDIYEEARATAPVSRKSAAGLLRLGLQLLVDDLEPGSGSIDAKIGALVTRGLDPHVQQAMDVLRVVGNESVHPGTIDLNTDDDLLPALFRLVNLIVEQVIARPRHVADLFAKLPPGKLEAIQRRDGKA